MLPNPLTFFVQQFVQAVLRFNRRRCWLTDMLGRPASPGLAQGLLRLLSVGQLAWGGEGSDSRYPGRR